MLANDIKILLNMKNKGWLSKEKITTKCGKTLHNNFQAINIFSY